MSGRAAQTRGGSAATRAVPALGPERPALPSGATYGVQDGREGRIICSETIQHVRNQDKASLVFSSLLITVVAP